ncbi:MAG: hypothetical protein KGL44_07290 [Sphingomonadales bacterium]|nr:hypothetical protein [Sphingomonadales bacterium]
MNQLAAMFAPLLLLLPGATAVDAARQAAGPVAGHGAAEQAGMVPPPSAVVADPEVAEAMAWSVLYDAFRAPVQDQVRIEQRMTIRITPRAPAPMPEMLMDLPRQGISPRFEERNFGRCLPISGIAGVEYGGGNRLVLYLRDQRIVSAELEKACRARDFYSGFYVDRNADGQICVDRDMLHSRAGTNCSVKRLRQLIDADD